MKPEYGISNYDYHNCDCFTRSSLGCFLQVSDYLTFCVPREYHAFALELSSVALFEEYIRGRITDLDIRILSGSSKSGMVLARKVRKPKRDSKSESKSSTVRKKSVESSPPLELNSCSSDSSDAQEVLNVSKGNFEGPQIS